MKEHGPNCICHICLPGNSDNQVCNDQALKEKASTIGKEFANKIEDALRDGSTTREHVGKMLMAIMSEKVHSANPNGEEVLAILVQSIDEIKSDTDPAILLIVNGYRFNMTPEKSVDIGTQLIFISGAAAQYIEDRRKPNSDQTSGLDPRWVDKSKPVEG